MSNTDSQYFETLDDVVPETPIQKKPARKGRKLTEEQRQRNIDNLRKGRETALKNRQKKAELKKLEQEQFKKDMDLKLQMLKGEKLPTKEDKNANKTVSPDNTLLEELKTLRAELQSLKTQQPPPTQPPQPPQPSQKTEDVKPLKKEVKEVKTPNKTIEKTEQKPLNNVITHQQPQRKGFLSINDILSNYK